MGGRRRFEFVGWMCAVVTAGIVGAALAHDGLPPAWFVVAGSTAFAVAAVTTFGFGREEEIFQDMLETAVVTFTLVAPAGHVITVGAAGAALASIRHRRVAAIPIGALQGLGGIVPAVLAVAVIADPEPGWSWFLAAVAGGVAHEVGAAVGLVTIVPAALGRPVLRSPGWVMVATTIPASIAAGSLGILVATAWTAGDWSLAPSLTALAGLVAAAVFADRARRHVRHQLIAAEVKALIAVGVDETTLERVAALVSAWVPDHDVRIGPQAVKGAALTVPAGSSLVLSAVPDGEPMPLRPGSRRLIEQLAAVIGAEVDATVAREALEEAASVDPLTGLGNRRAIAASSHADGFGVVLVDVNNLKALNDTVGHVAGDEVLKEVARRLRAVVRDDDVTARLGGDEFVVVTSHPQDLECLAERVRESLGGLPAPPELHVGVSVGTARSGPDGTTLTEILEVADGRMYDEKRRVARPTGYERTGRGG